VHTVTVTYVVCVVKTLVDRADIDRVSSVSCGWKTVCVVSQGLCYISEYDTSSALWRCVHVNLTDHQFDDLTQRSVSVQTTAAAGATSSDQRLLSTPMQRGGLEATDVREHFVCVETNDTWTLAVTSERNLVSICRDRLTVERLLTGFKVSSVSCGRCHSLVLSAIGVVFSCGLGNHGQLGHGSLDSEPSLRVIEALEGVTMMSVCAGGWHSVALSDAGDVYVWGWNDVGQLGLCITTNRHSAHLVATITSTHLASSRALLSSLVSVCASVCLSVCLPDNKITRKRLDGCPPK